MTSVSGRRSAPGPHRVRPAGNGCRIEVNVGERPRRKSFRLHQSKIDRAMERLGPRTETETIEQALDAPGFGDAVVKGTRAMRGAALVDVFGDEHA